MGSTTLNGHSQKNQYSFKIVIFGNTKIHTVMEKMEARKYAIIEKVMHLNEEELTELERSMLKFSESPASIEQYNRELDEAEAEMDRGAFYTQEEVEKMAKKL